MGLKTLTIDLQALASRHYLYASYKFHYFNKEIQKTSNLLTTKVSDYCEVFTGYAFKSEDYEGDGTKLLRIGDFDKFGDVNTQEMAFLPEDYADKYRKYQIKNEDIVIALTGATIGKTSYMENLKEIILLNQRVGLIRAKNKHINFKLFYYLTKLNSFKFQIQIDAMGKGQQNISPTDVSKIKIPFIAKSLQDRIIAQIEPIEKKIKEFKNQITPAQEIINNFFAKEFGFDLEKYNELKKIKNYYLELSAFANNKDVRQSVKFHRKAGIFVLQELKKITDKKIKNFISEPIMLGNGISPSDFDDEGDYYYISMANIKNWRFESEGSKLVSKEYSDKNQTKTVAKNDILFARSGEGTIGKVALIDDDDLQGVFADFTMRIRLYNYNNQFAYYYFRTDYFQYLIEINKKGLGNNTNIFPSQIKEFPMIDILLKDQQRIVDEIKTKLDKQEEIKKEIEIERAKIAEIIEKAIRYT